VRRAFKEILGVKLHGDHPVTIVAFRDAQEYEPYQPHDGAFAFYMPQPHRDFIVIQDLLPEHYQVILHEYTHLVIHQAGMKLPLWLNEGFAELYATMRPMGSKIWVGRVMPQHLQVAEAGLANLREILDADTRSKVYNEKDRMGIFYAESWAMVHMLKFSDAYSPGFEGFLDAVGRGEESGHALERVYRKPLEAIQADLKAYVHGNHFFEGVIHARIDKVAVEPIITPKDPFETKVMLAGIEALGSHRDRGLRTLEMLAESNPGRPEPFEEMAWAHLASTSPQSAIAPFRLAIEAGTHDADLCFRYAVGLRAIIPEADYLAALRRATEIDPGNSAAQQILAVHAFNSRDYPEAVKRLHLVKKLDRANAFTYYRLLSYAAFQTGQTDEAKSAAKRAQQYASTDEEHRFADQIASYVTGAGSMKPPEVPAIEAR
jgi:tetratricopeptide (TPR) repeat protein